AWCATLAWALAPNWPTPFSSSRFHSFMPEEVQPLTSLGVGARATVAEVRIPSPHRARLLEMGLVTGTPIELVRFAPLGDPVEIKVRGYHLSLRKQEAEQIWVQAKS